jgi:hypothetical protein
MQQQQATTTTIGVKATFVPTDEHRFLALPTPPSFVVLIDKLASLFAIDSASDLRVHYIDDESDRVAMSSSDELTCALSLVPAGRQLRLFVTSATHAVPSPMRHQRQQEKQVKDEPIEAQECALPTAIVSTVVDASPNSAVERAVSASEASSQEVVATLSIDVLKGQLQASGIEIGLMASTRTGVSASWPGSKATWPRRPRPSSACTRASNFVNSSSWSPDPVMWTR